MLVTKSAVATDAGISLQLRNMSGEQLEFTKLEVGSGQYGQDEATAEALRKRTTLKAKKQQFGISSIDVSSDKTTLILSSMITNTDLKEGYTIRELGLYARIKDQPDTECLVSVSLAEIEDEIPPYDSDPESRILMKYQFAVSDSDTVSLSYEHAPVALVEDVDAKVARLLEKTKTLQSELENVKKELLGVVKQTAIVNNNTTTEAGFALDARQANPNIAGTLAANILQLNNDSNSGLQEYTATVSAGVKIVSQKSQYLKIGKLVFVNISLWCDPSESTDPAYISLPYPVGSFRNFGAVTYYINAKDYKNLYVSANAGNQHCYIGALLTDDVPHVFDGTDMTTIQFSLLYATE